MTTAKLYLTSSLTTLLSNLHIHKLYTDSSWAQRRNKTVNYSLCTNLQSRHRVSATDTVIKHVSLDIIIICDLLQRFLFQQLHFFPLDSCTFFPKQTDKVEELQPLYFSTSSFLLLNMC